VYAAIECFVCRLYGASTDSINEARYKLFCLAADKSERSLPPTSDALRQHAMRAAYQCGIWLCVLKPIMDAPTPCGHGWQIAERGLEIVWMTYLLHQLIFWKLTLARARRVPAQPHHDAHAERPVCPVLHHADAISVKTLTSEIVTEEVSEGDDWVRLYHSAILQKVDVLVFGMLLVKLRFNMLIWCLL